MSDNLENEKLAADVARYQSALEDEQTAHTATRRELYAARQLILQLFIENRAALDMLSDNNEGEAYNHLVKARDLEPDWVSYVYAVLIRGEIPKLPAKNPHAYSA